MRRETFSPESPTPEPSPDVLRETIARLTAENHSLERENERLREIAMKDPLTGLWNRRGLAETVELLFPEKNAERSEHRGKEREGKREAAVLVLDIDNFKIINDLYGHDGGDAVIKKAAETLRDSLRATDIVCRWGGEEFVAVFRGADAQNVINKFYRKDDQRAEFSFETELNGEPVSITMSGGVTDLLPGESLAVAVARADSGLYAAKEAGKNRIERVPSETERKFPPASEGKR